MNREDAIVKELLRETDFIYTQSESEFQRMVVNDIDEISFMCGWGEVERVETEYIMAYKNNRPRCDIMIWHKDGTGTIIECKLGGNNKWLLSAIGQCLYYKQIAGMLLKNEPRIVLASNDIPQEVYGVIKSNSLKINLLQVDENRIVYV